MTHQLYVEIFNLITDSLGYEEEKIREYEDQLIECEDIGETQLFASRIKKHHKKRVELESLLRDFEEQVVEPEC